MLCYEPDTGGNPTVASGSVSASPRGYLKGVGLLQARISGLRRCHRLQARCNRSSDTKRKKHTCTVHCGPSRGHPLHVAEPGQSCRSAVTPSIASGWSLGWSPPRPTGASCRTTGGCRATVVTEPQTRSWSDLARSTARTAETTYPLFALAALTGMW